MTTKLRALLPAFASAAVLAAVSASTGAHAQGVDDGSLEPSSEGLRLRVTPYVWLAGVDGTVSVFPRRAPGPGADIDADFLDITPHLKAAFLMKAEISQGRWGLFGDLAYAGLKGEQAVTIRDPLVLSARIDISTVESTLAVRYRLYEDSRTAFDVLGGFRYDWSELTVALEFNDKHQLTTVKSRGWFDPLVGARGQLMLSKRWGLTAYGDVGGFGVSSDITWQAVGSVNYRLSRMARLHLGYRHYVVDYDKNDFVYDVAAHGPVLGATFRF